MQNKLQRAPTILDSFGKPAANFSRDYEGAFSDRFRKYLGSRSTRTEEAMLPKGTRQSIIAYLRRGIRNNPVLRAICNRYALAIGSPTIHAETDDPLYNDLKEIYLEKKMKRIGRGRLSLSALCFIIGMERVIGGELFAIFLENGKVQLMPSEMCGSPENAPKDEIQGIGYDSNGDPKYYRFGTRTEKHGRGSISFEKGDSVIRDAEWVRHIWQNDRIEAGRASPPLSAAIAAIQDLLDITTSKVMQIKIQAAYSLFITKNMDPQLFAEMISNSEGAAQRRLIDTASARGDYQEISPGGILYGEIGESVEQMSPQIQAADFGEFERGRLYFICACLGIPPEEAILGYSKSNYSSSRADKLRWKQVVDADRLMLRDTFLDDLQAWQCRRGVQFNELPPVPEGQSYEVNMTWPPLPAVDPAKEAAEDIALMESGLETRSEIVGRRGRHADTVAKRIVAEAFNRAKLLIEAAGEDRDPTIDEIRAEMPNGKTAAEVLQSLRAVDTSTNSNNE